MLAKLCVSVFLFSLVVFGLPVEDDGFVGLGNDYPPNLPHFVMNTSIWNGEDRIWGGREAAVGQFPHQISIRSDSGHRCGGSILNERFILTAAHCVEKSHPNQFRVVVGAHENNYDNGTFHNVRRLIVHEDFILVLNEKELTVRNDIALIQTSTPIQFNELVRPIPLHPGFIKKAKAVTSGWGRTNDRIRNLKYLEMNTLTNDECRKLIIEAYPRPPPSVHDWDTLCAFSGRRLHSICNGDSGGPLVVDNKLIGITSWGYINIDKCGRGVPDGFTRVSNYIDWINKNMQTFRNI